MQYIDSEQQYGYWYHDDHRDHVREEGFYHTYDSLFEHKVHIFLPQEYKHNTSARYPVLYMNDGQCTFWNGGLINKSWCISESLAHLWKEGKVRKIIVVGIEPKDRSREYTHDKALEGQAYGGLHDYANWLCGLKSNFVDVHYRTQSESSLTGIGGASLGGLASFYISTVHPDHFGIGICMSSSLWVGAPFKDTHIRDSTLVRAATPGLENKYSRPRLWIDWGFPESLQFEKIARRSKEIVDILNVDFGYQEGIDLFVYEDEWGVHNEDSWSGRFPYVLQCFYGNN